MELFGWSRNRSYFDLSVYCIPVVQVLIQRFGPMMKNILCRESEPEGFKMAGGGGDQMRLGSVTHK